MLSNDTHYFISIVKVTIYRKDFKYFRRFVETLTKNAELFFKYDFGPCFSGLVITLD